MRILPTVSAIRADLLAATRYAAKPVVGILGAAVPVEVVLAAGCHPLLLAGDATDFDADCPPMERTHEPEIRSLFRQAVGGRFEHCRLLVIASSSDGYRFLFQYLTEIKRTGRGARIPALALYDFQFGDSPSVADYNLKVVNKLLTTLLGLGGARTQAHALATAIERCNALRYSLQQLEQARMEGRIPGSAALRHVAALDWSMPERSANELAAAVTRLPPAESPMHPRMLIATGVPFYHERLHLLLESCGAQVIMESDEWGSRRGAPALAPGDTPEVSICRYYREHTSSPRQPTARREAWLRTRLASNQVDALLLYAPPSDQFFGWECPSLTLLASDIGLPAWLLRQEALDDGQAATARAQLQGRLSTLERRYGHSGRASGPGGTP